MKHIISLLFIVLFSTPVTAQPIVSDISADSVEISTNFDGAEIVVFGSTLGRGDVAVVVQGPVRDTIVHKKKEKGWIWMNAERTLFADVPTVYHIASTKPLEQLADESVLRKNQIGLNNITLAPKYLADAPREQEFKTALIAQRQETGFYSEYVNEVEFQADRLFKTTLTLPPGIPTGTYRVETFLFENGSMVTAQLKTFEVEKVGFSARIYNFAHESSFAYSLLAVALAFAYGTLMAFAFRQA